MRGEFAWEERRGPGTLQPCARTDHGNEGWPPGTACSPLPAGERGPSGQRGRGPRGQRGVHPMAAPTRRRDGAPGRDGGDGAGRESVAELRRAHEQLTLILDGIADGVTVEDRRGRLVYANAAAADLLGYPSADALLAADPAQA